jgi:hypothetical protein
MNIFFIEWTLFLNVSSVQKCEKIIDELKDRIPNLNTEKIEKYWKEIGLYRVVLKSSTKVETTFVDKDKRLLIVLELIYKLADQWTLSNPFDDEFCGMAVRNFIKNPAIHSIDFRSL